MPLLLALISHPLCQPLPLTGGVDIRLSASLLKESVILFLTGLKADNGFVPFATAF